MAQYLRMNQPFPYLHTHTVQVQSVQHKSNANLRHPILAYGTVVVEAQLTSPSHPIPSRRIPPATAINDPHIRANPSRAHGRRAANERENGSGIEWKLLYRAAVVLLLCCMYEWEGRGRGTQA